MLREGRIDRLFLSAALIASPHRPILVSAYALHGYKIYVRNDVGRLSDMEFWLTWVVVIAIGLVLGFVVHALMRFAQNVSVLATLLAGVLGAILGAFLVAFYLPVIAASPLATQLIWAVIGAIVLSILVELLFVGTRHGRVVTS